MENEIIFFFIVIVSPWVLLLAAMVWVLIKVIKEARFYDKAYKAACKWNLKRWEWKRK